MGRSCFLGISRGARACRIRVAVELLPVLAHWQWLQIETALKSRFLCGFGFSSRIRAVHLRQHTILYAPSSLGPRAILFTPKYIPSLAERVAPKAWGGLQAQQWWQFFLTWTLSAVLWQFLLTEAKPPGSQKPALLYTRRRCVMTFCTSLNLPLFFFLFFSSFLFVKHLLCRHVAGVGLDKHS